MSGAPEIRQLKPEDDVGVTYKSAAAIALIQGMTRRKIHSRSLIDYGRLQRFGKLDQARHPGGSARGAVGNDDWIFRRHKKTRRFGNRARISLWQRVERKFW